MFSVRNAYDVDFGLSSKILDNPHEALGKRHALILAALMLEQNVDKPLFFVNVYREEAFGVMIIKTIVDEGAIFHLQRVEIHHFD